MKAILWTKYGAPDGLQLREVAQPVPADDEVQIHVHAATVSAADTELRTLKQPLVIALPLRVYLGIRKPTRITVLGTEFAGEIVAVGKAVTRYQPGDQVFGYTGLGMGTYAEYLCLPETPSALGSVMGKKPTNLSYEQAAAVAFGGLEALHALSKIQIQHGQTVLILGAGGSIGTCALQLASHYGADVTAVDKAEKFAMLRAIGANHVIDYTREDFCRRGQTYDVILDTVGKTSVSRCLNVLKDHGTLLNARPGLLSKIHHWTSKSSKRTLPWTAGYTAKNLLALKDLLETEVFHPIIDRRYPLEQIAEAHRYVETGQKKGNVVITMA